jgi:glycosyltransferase involved in cell wall biosynthesis
MGRPRILIVSYNWPPRNAIGTHRPYSWAKYWSQWGADITVLTACKYGFDEPLDLHLPQLEAVQILEVPFFQSGATSAITPIAQGKVIARLKAIRRWLSKTVGLDLDIRRGWFRAAAGKAAALAPSLDVVVSSYGPAASHLLAAHMKKLNPVLRWTADYRDLWNAGTHGNERSRLEEQATVGRYADALTTVSDELAENLRQVFRQKVDVVYNGFDEAASLGAAMRMPNRQLSESRPRSVRIVYTGLIAPGDRDPTLLFRAVKQLEPILKAANVIVSVHFYGARLGDLKQIVAREKAENIAVIHGHVNRDTALRQQASADALLILESPSKDGNLTGKIFEYLSAARPIISIGSRKQSAIGRILTSCGSGICAEQDVETISEALLDVVRGGESGWFQPKRNKIQEYSRENQARIMFALVNA